MSQDDRETWDARWSDPGHGPAAPSAVLLAVADRLPARGRALDLACGAGRHGVWLARRGLDVTCADVSPVALERARASARLAGVELSTKLLDVDDLFTPAPPALGPFDAVVCFHFLDRRLFPRWSSLLAPGGVLVFVQPTRTNLERHPRPSARFLLEPGEAAALAASSGLSVVRADEGWLEEGRHEARLVLRSPA